MGFPIKKRINCANHCDYRRAPCGLDLLSAAIDARLGSVAQPEPAPSSSLGPPQAQGAIALSWTRRVSGSDSEESFAAPDVASSHIADSSGSRRSRPFPAVLRDILSDPEHDSVVSWLPHGRSFVVHDTKAFSSEVLPKYFRKVVFRSFARKLNRWGFRSVTKSISGFEATFEHNLFRRDEPELSQGMKCRSNPAASKSQAAVAAGQARATSQTQAIAKHTVPLQVQAPSQAIPLQTEPALIAPASALRGNRNEGFPADPIKPQSQELDFQALRNALEEEVDVRLQKELILRNLQRCSRERAILQFLRDASVSQLDAVSRYIA